VPHHLNTRGIQKTSKIDINGDAQSVLRSSRLNPDEKTLRECSYTPLQILNRVWWWVSDEHMTLLGTDTRPLCHFVGDWQKDAQMLRTNCRNKWWKSSRRRQRSISWKFIWLPSNVYDAENWVKAAQRESAPLAVATHRHTITCMKVRAVWMWIISIPYLNQYKQQPDVTLTKYHT
jgi:hypothetical protein